MSGSVFLRLRDEVTLELEYADETPFGSALGAGIEQRLRHACRAILEERQAHGMADVVKRSKALLQAAFTTALQPLFESRTRLREECLFPDPERVRPVALRVRIEGGAQQRFLLAPSAVRQIAPWIAEFQRGTRRPSSTLGSSLFDAFAACGAFSEEPVESEVPSRAETLFVGHASVAHLRNARVLFDPFFPARSVRYPADYQPLRAVDFPNLDAVFITHSHPDHFDPVSLFGLGADTRIYVPAVERESLLSLDMAARLAELGFSNVERLVPEQTVTLPGADILALPFLGEQPTTGEVLHPEIRNQGLVYALSSPEGRLLFLADSGRDRDGDVSDLAARARRELADFDLVFGGYRAFAIYPIHYLFSSVARYLLFVPESEWAVRQKTMNDGDDLIQAAERAGARYVVPYADGGAPWYWERGLGPQLDGAGSFQRSFDPPPDDVALAAANRSGTREGAIATPVSVLILRPGESISLDQGAPRVDHGPRQHWPYERGNWLQKSVALVRRDGSALASARAIFAALAPKLSEWRASGALSGFWFMRKPPDLRLRFAGDASFAAELAALLEHLTSQGHIERVFDSVYQPELARFGGAEAMRSVHEFFDVDTAAWMALEELRVAAGARLDPLEFSALATDTLVRAASSDSLEVLTLWSEYAHVLGGASTAPRTGQPRALDALRARATREEAHILAGLEQAGRRLCESLLELEASGRLTANLRDVVTAIVQFHCHRHGLDGSAQATLAQEMSARLRGLS